MFRDTLKCLAQLLSASRAAQLYSAREQISKAMNFKSSWCEKELQTETSRNLVGEK